MKFEKKIRFGKYYYLFDEKEAIKWFSMFSGLSGGFCIAMVLYAKFFSVKPLESGLIGVFLLVLSVVFGRMANIVIEG